MSAQFLAHIEQNTVPLPWSGCSIWMGAITAGGYARSVMAQRLHGTTIVHRAVYQALHGPVEAGMYVCHRCDTPSCVNPDHLFLGTPSDNAIDRARKGRSAPRKGRLNGRAKLNEDDVIRVRARLAQGILQRDIAAEINASPSQVSHISRGYTWRHV